MLASSMLRALIVLTTAFLVSCEVHKSIDKVCFDNIQFGVATAAYQIEGAWNISGKGESMWDRYTHTYPERVFDHSNGDEAADSYHRFREDVRMMKHLGIFYYRFSISWSRILPTGYINEVNEDGIRYYNELLDELLRNKLVPLVTMYHWDLPQPLQDLGGWTNPVMADYYTDYARLLFSTFGSKVDSWLTFNEPLTFCLEGYGGDDAPGSRSSGIEAYLCAHNVLRAHGMTTEMFKKEFQKKGANIGISLNFPWMEPETTSKQDQMAAETARQFMFGWYAHPIFSLEGDYPSVMRKRIDEMSKRQNFPRSRLPTFTKKEIKQIRSSTDFLGLNHYTSYLVRPSVAKPKVQPSFYADAGVIITQKAEWPKSNSTWLKVVPWGFRKALNWVKDNYLNPPVVITENGISTQRGLNDIKRIQYIEGYLKSLHDAIYKDYCTVIGYTYWSLMDNFEWMRGYSERFGLYEVDFKSPNKTRTARKSAVYFAEIAKTKCLPDSSLYF